MVRQLKLFELDDENDDDFVSVDTINKKNELKVISLFSGCGGMDLGFTGGFDIFGRHYEKNPYEIVFANDIVQKACNTYTYNFGHGSYCCDIKELDYSKLPKADIVIGGFPCQDFSLAGKRRGFEAERGRLYLEMKKVIDYVKPIAFVAENVDGIRKNKKNMENSPLDVIIDDFKKSGYDVIYKPLNASSYGVPQNRVRIIIIGIRKDIGKKIKYPKPTYGLDNENGLFTSKEAIDDLWDKIDKTEIKNHTTKDYSKAKFYPGKKMQGNNRICADKPAPTIRAEHHGNIEAHYRTFNERDSQNMINWRRLSVRECARLQSFPDNFVFPCASTDAYRQIGNAVPPILGWNIARALYKSLYEE